MPATSVTMTLDFTYQGKQQSQYLIIMKVVIVMERDRQRNTPKKRVIPNTCETQKMMFHRISKLLFSIY